MSVGFNKIVPAPLNEEEKHEHDERDGNPLVIMMYDFLTEPKTSKAGVIWGYIAAGLVIIHVLALGLESCDGPNQYDGRRNNAQYKFLLTTTGYWIIELVCIIPLLVDSFCRLVLLGFLFFVKENAALRKRFLRDSFGLCLMIMDFISLLPFLIEQFLFSPNDIELKGNRKLILVFLDLMLFGRILRVTKDIPAIWAVRIALSRSFGHLVLPLFFFMAFNITGAVIFYFFEPCYDREVCPWSDLFDALFFSVVTMTTTGYGNQIPVFELARFVSCCVMIFGALFLSMPLAIIGNEYSDAWSEITERLQKQRMLQLEKEQERWDKLYRQTVSLATAKLDNTIGQTLTKFPSTLRRGRSGILTGATPAISALSTASIMPAVKEEADGEESHRDDGGGAASRARRVAMQGQEEKEQRNKSVIATVLSADEELEALRSGCPKPTAMQLKSALNPILNRSRLIECYCRLQDAVTRMEFEQDVAAWLNPSLLLYMCELRGWLSPFLHNFDVAFNACVVDLSGSATVAAARGNGGRRLSIFSGNAGSMPHLLRQNPDPLQVFRNTMMGNIREVSSLEDLQEDSDSDSVDSGNEASLSMKKMISSKAPELDPRGNVVHSSVRTITPGSGRLRHSNSRKSSFAKRKKACFRAIRRGYRKLAKLWKLFWLSSKQTEFSVMMQKISDDPHSIRNRLWMLLELHQSSNAARMVQLVLLLLICLSILLLFTESLTSWSSYGEGHPVCGQVLHIYCRNKHNNLLDPGCFVHDLSGVTSRKLDFSCHNGDNCFASGYNFGAPDSNVTCNALQPPFQSKSDLLRNYGKPTLFTSRPVMHQTHAICSRSECNPNHKQLLDGNKFWAGAELIITVIFTLEYVVRIAVTDSVLRYLREPMNLFDLLSILPFYVEFYNAGGIYRKLDFALLSSSPDGYFVVISKAFKVFRLFKLTRHFRATKVLSETARRAFKQVLGILLLMVFLVVLFAILLFEVEQGKVCFVGEKGCFVPENIQDTVRVGDRLVINKLKGSSQFGNVFYGLWFSFVTLTTTGYGDIVPVTNAGQIMACFLMLAGSLYLSMPLTVASSTFYEVHQQYTKKRRDAARVGVDLEEIRENNKNERQQRMWRGRLTQFRSGVAIAMQKVDALMRELQQPLPREKEKELREKKKKDKRKDSKRGPSELVKRCVEISSSLKLVLHTATEDVEQMAKAYEASLDAIQRETEEQNKIALELEGNK